MTNLIPMSPQEYDLLVEAGQVDRDAIYLVNYLPSDYALAEKHTRYNQELAREDSQNEPGQSSKPKRVGWHRASA